MLKRVLTFVPILVMLMFGACSGQSEDSVSPLLGTHVAQTQTATMWTPTVTPTPDPDTAQIVTLLNNGIIASDPLRDTLGAKFSVLDVRFPPDNTSHTMLVMQIDVECEWTITDSCTTEETFVSLMHGFIASDKVIDKIRSQVPPSVNDVLVTALKRMVRNGVIIVSWKDVVDFAAHRLTGNQLASRIRRP